MKHTIYLLLAVASLMSSCIIREPENREVLTQSGLNLSWQANDVLTNELRMLDKVLFIQSYSDTANTYKSAFLKETFPQYNLKFSGNSWYITDSGKDTVYTILTDSKSIHQPGAEWQVAYFRNTLHLTIKCAEKNKWQLLVSKVDSTYGYRLYKTDLTVFCSDASAPVTYQKGNFEVTGSSSFGSYVPYFFRFNINEALKHDKISTNFSQGKMTVEVNDTINNRKSSTVVDYLNNGSIQITFNGIKQVYDHQYYTDFYN